MSKSPNLATLRLLLNYNPETGTFLWNQRNRNLTGKIAGGVDQIHGYRRIRINGRMVLAHQIAIALTTGEWPKGQVDHINGIRDDNRACNLRVVSKGENLRNKRIYQNNKTERVGVHWHKQHRKWCASIQKDGRRVTLGVFHDFAKAVAARAAAEISLGFHQNHGRKQ
jgi:hypothetical protein